jgi:cell division protein FtsB
MPNNGFQRTVLALRARPAAEPGRWAAVKPQNRGHTMRALPAFLLFVVCTTLYAAEPQDELAQDHLQVMERFIAILGTVKDVASAKQYKPELEALSAQNKAIFQRAKSLNLSRDTMVKYLQHHYRTRSQAVFEGIFARMSEVSRLPEFDAIGQILAKEVNYLSNTNWSSVSSSSRD